MDGSAGSQSRVSTLLLLLAFATVYVVWGSTYLAIRFAIETIPPFLMAGLRMLSAGAVLYGACRLRDRARPTWRHWRSASVVGCLMLVGGNGLVTWAEQHVASGLAALMIATVPLWMVLLDWVAFGGLRPTGGIVAGLILGLVGVLILRVPSGVAGEPIHFWGAIALLAACVFWATGSLHSRRAELPKSLFLAAAMEMIAAGVAFFVLATALGEWSRFDLARVSTRSWLSVAYLSLFGSILALSAYTWLLRVTTPARVATYAYVNPVVAILLGATLAHEPMTLRVVAAAGVIIASVVIITMSKARRRPADVRAKTAAPTRDDPSFQTLPPPAMDVRQSSGVIVPPVSEVCGATSGKTYAPWCLMRPQRTPSDGGGT
ncbi:MAG: drug/metabolite exporter YedA [Phycisphaerales bacterium]|nr:MAG: drug/metabolite exporter YedA [Phycisphaerales bacterium]